MNVEIYASETSLTQAEKEYIGYRLEHALSKNESQITQIQIWVVGILRADGDEAQFCLINVKLIDGSLVACDGTDAELKTAVSHATQRVCREVTRNVELLQSATADKIDSSLAWQQEAASSDRGQKNI